MIEPGDDGSTGIPGSNGGSGSWLFRTFASLRHANYRRVFIGQSLSLVGTWMQSVALAWLVLQLTQSATWLGAAVALQTLPVLLLGPYGGLVADRVDKRRLLICTQSAAAVQALALGILTATGTESLRVVLVLCLLLGSINAVDNPARQAFVREMVPDDTVGNAVALNAVLVNVARAVGPAVGGVIIATLGVAACFFVNAASFIAVLIAYASLNRRTLTPVEPTRRAPGQLRAGFRYVRRTPDLLIPLSMMALVGTLTYEFQVSLPALATETFNSGAGGLGVITAAMGTGAVLGGLATAGRRITGIAAMTLAAGAFAGTDLLAALAPTVPFAVIALVGVGAASVWFLSSGNATLQLASAPAMRGRVMALWSVAFIGSTPVGGPIIGWIAEHAGPRWALAVGAAAALLATVLGSLILRHRSNRHRSNRPHSNHRKTLA